jgi:hypothetical protein
MLRKNLRRTESGSALVYILIAIALLAALTITFMEPSSQQTSSQNTFKTLTEVETQSSMIRAAVQECVLSYPQGDSSIDNSGGGSDPDARKNFPIKPSSSHYATSTILPTAGDLVKDIRCPGNNPGGVNVFDHEPIFVGGEGKFLPPAPDLFKDWQYYNGADGIFFWTETDKTDAFLAAALAKLDEKYAECEADVVDASAADEDMDSDGDYVCPEHSTCFRVWMVMNKASAEFNGDTDGDEAACAP